MNPMSKLNSYLLIVATLSLYLTGTTAITCADAPTVEKDNKGREILREQLPDYEEGWFVASKSTYWPLCYEALDRLEECRELIGKSKNKELAMSLEKSAAWLGLAASAAMTDGKAGIQSCQDRLNTLATSLRTGTDVPNDNVLSDSVTLGELCVAKSHILRATAPDNEYKVERRTLGKSKTPSAVIKEAEKEIRSAQNEARIIQFRYDAVDSLRHLKVAKTYLTEAAKGGQISIPESVAAAIPEIASLEATEDLESEYDSVVLPRIEEMAQVIEEQRIALVNKLRMDDE